MRQVNKLGGAYNAALWVMERDFKKVNRGVSDQIHKLRREVEKEFPVVARLLAASLGPFLLWSTRREEKRLASGRSLRTADVSGASQLDTGFIAFSPRGRWRLRICGGAPTRQH